MAPSPKLILLLFCVKILTTSAWQSECPPWWEHPAQDVHLPHPTDCGQFLTCVPGGTVPQRCPAGLHWNDRRKVCDWPWIAGCNVRPVGCSFGQLLPHVDCDKYYLCLDNSRKIVLYCPESLHFNADSKKCVHPWYAGCGGWTPPTPTTLPPTTAPPSTTPQDLTTTDPPPTTTQHPTSAPPPLPSTLTTLAPSTSTWPATTVTEAPGETSSLPGTSEAPHSTTVIDPTGTEVPVYITAPPV